MSVVDAIAASYRDIGRANAQRAQGGAILGQSIADVGRQIAQLPLRQQRLHQFELQTQEHEMRAASLKRSEAADAAIQNATQNALNPDGTIDRGKYSASIAGSPAAAKLPTLLESFDRLDESRLRLQRGEIDLQGAKDDAIGLAVHSADQFDDAHDKAGAVTAALASAVKGGLIKEDESKHIVSSFLGDDGEPDAARIDQAIKALKAKSPKTVRMEADEASKSAAAESAGALADQRTEITRQTKLRNFANQLGSATSQAEYQRRYAHVPKDLRDQFASPDEWTPDVARATRDMMLTPAEREAKARNEEAIVRDRDTNAYRTTMATIAGRNADSSSRNADSNALRASRTGSGASDKAKKEEKADYKTFASQYEKAQTETAKRAPYKMNTTDDEGKPLKKPTVAYDPITYLPTRDVGAYVPPPSFNKWQAMTPAERAAVLHDPNARINDAELQRRTSGAAAAPSSEQMPVVGQILSLKGKKMKITAVHPNGRFDAVEAK